MNDTPPRATDHDEEARRANADRRAEDDDASEPILPEIMASGPVPTPTNIMSRRPQPRRR